MSNLSPQDSTKLKPFIERRKELKSESESLLNKYKRTLDRDLLDQYHAKQQQIKALDEAFQFNTGRQFEHQRRWINSLFRRG